MAGKFKPRVPSLAPSKSPVTGKPDAPKRFRFGFRFWKQIDFFGLDHQPPNEYDVTILMLPKGDHDTIDELIREGKAKSIAEILTHGMLALMAE